MRADVLLGCVALLFTACASVPHAPGRTLSYASPTATDAPGAWVSNDEAPRASAPVPSVTPDEEAPPLYRRKAVREVVTGASPVRRVAMADVTSPDDSQPDVWERLLTNAGLEARDERPLAGGLTPAQAARLMDVLLGKPVTLSTFPPRMAAGFILREVMEGGEVTRRELLRRVERFSREQVAVLRPDGALAWALTGRTQQKVATVEWKDGAFRAHGFELGRFYSGKGGVFRAVDARLQASDWRPLAEVYDDADVLSRTLDGAEDALVELYHALGQLLTRPVDSIAGLSHLPTGVAALIAASPMYWERFQSMTRGEQIREVSRLTTGLLMTGGAASATTRTLKGMALGAEVSVPVLSLSAEGALALERVAVPAGRAAAVLNGGPGAAIILQRANTASKGGAPAKGPGQWGPANESMSPRARRYQEQITGHTADEAYWVGGMGQSSGGVKFDGFKDGALLEAKGPGYARFFDELEPKDWFRHSGAKDLIEQAERQTKKARGLGVWIEWHVAEEKAAAALRSLLREAGVEGVKVLHTPAL
ncbi:restriction endonuclease fold toxin 5 domain-containing protein [Corallococcus sp. AS-1-6]|uniref:restriction endonuclease fold toxin 5 domain-containing protein n=1 Tax=Corallococcus sp. AS-1-6 TaxID=2874599 RepID=UPI001CBC852B|nr:restriction endonuclease fold toxin 5 domain-containing protein [Corallococcus sp. AS-1-6]MBZ4375143.1 restriction endonuclease fold toxin 5 domain-containing protein [Corallococcus sp. AS-1-6]